MRNAILLAVAYLVTAVAGYDLYGGYERMYYYYAYLIDCGTHQNNVPSHIAPSCRQVMNLPVGSKCNFNQFIAFINNVPANSVRVSTAEYPDVDATANALNNARLTGTYEFGRIYPGTANSVNDLVQNVANVVAGNHGTNTQLANARTAIDRVQFLRGYANHNALKTMLQGIAGVRIFDKTASSGPITYTDWLDVAATEKRNGNLNDAVKTAIRNDNLNNQAHLDNVRGAQKAKTVVQQCRR